MKVLCYGSLNIDITYRVNHIVKEGETISSYSVIKGAGGKGANQSAALAKAGLRVFHSGKLGADGAFILDKLKSFGVDTSLTIVTDNQSGNAIIQVDDEGQNSIILFSGENKNILKAEVDSVLSNFEKGDWLVIQNEINELEYIINRASEKGINICFNPAPMDEAVFKLPLDKVTLLVVNEIEGAALALTDGDFEEILNTLCQKYPKCKILMTLGDKGSLYYDGSKVYHHSCFKVDSVDTTAAGDTFIGYFLKKLIDGEDAIAALTWASAASAIAVSRKGAMDSVPYYDEVRSFLGESI